jgi:hypothetical protein
MNELRMRLIGRRAEFGFPVGSASRTTQSPARAADITVAAVDKNLNFIANKMEWRCVEQKKEDRVNNKVSRRIVSR